LSFALEYQGAIEADGTLDQHVTHALAHGAVVVWHILHSQVVFYEQKMSDACSTFQKQNICSKNVVDTDKFNAEPAIEDLVSEENRRSIISRVLSEKRRMHMSICTETNTPSKFSSLLDENLVRRFLCDDDDADKKIRNLQLSAATAIKNKSRNHHSFSKNMFLCLTANLGKSWKAIIADAVEADKCSKDALFFA
jgi:hypothetical protein